MALTFAAIGVVYVMYQVIGVIRTKVCAKKFEKKAAELQADLFGEWEGLFTTVTNGTDSQFNLVRSLITEMKSDSSSLRDSQPQLVHEFDSLDKYFSDAADSEFKRQVQDDECPSAPTYHPKQGWKILLDDFLGHQAFATGSGAATKTYSVTSAILKTVGVTSATGFLSQVAGPIVGVLGLIKMIVDIVKFEQEFAEMKDFINVKISELAYDFHFKKCEMLGGAIYHQNVFLSQLAGFKAELHTTPLGTKYDAKVDALAEAALGYLHKLQELYDTPFTVKKHVGPPATCSLMSEENGIFDRMSVDNDIAVTDVMIEPHTANQYGCSHADFHWVIQNGNGWTRFDKHRYSLKKLGYADDMVVEPLCFAKFPHGLSTPPPASLASDLTDVSGGFGVDFGIVSLLMTKAEAYRKKKLPAEIVKAHSISDSSLDAVRRSPPATNITHDGLVAQQTSFPKSVAKHINWYLWYQRGGGAPLVSIVTPRGFVAPDTWMREHKKLMGLTVDPTAKRKVVFWGRTAGARSQKDNYYYRKLSVIRPLKDLPERQLHPCTTGYTPATTITTMDSFKEAVDKAGAALPAVAASSSSPKPLVQQDKAKDTKGKGKSKSRSSHQ